MNERRTTQLYLISPLDVTGGYAERLARALDAGPVAAFQFRVKGIDEHAAVALAEPLQVICADRDVAFIVNDSISLAKRIGADGVHLGQSDGTVAKRASVWASWRRSASPATTAATWRWKRVMRGRTMSLSGPSFRPRPSRWSTAPSRKSSTWWQGLFELPCVAIGGITPENCGELVRAGADFLAVSGAVWGGDEAAAVKAFHLAIEAAPA